MYEPPFWLQFEAINDRHPTKDNIRYFSFKANPYIAFEFLLVLKPKVWHVHRVRYMNV